MQKKYPFWGKMLGDEVPTRHKGQAWKNNRTEMILTTRGCSIQVSIGEKNTIASLTTAAQSFIL
jgi:hypothetical protein